MATAPSTQQDNNNLETMVCYTANGQPVSIQTSTGSCPMGLFSKPPDTMDAFSESETGDTFVDEDEDEDEDEDDDDVEDYIPQFQSCFSRCKIFSGSENQQSEQVSYVGGGDCPASHPFSTKPSCEIPDDVQGRFDSYQAQIDALLEDLANSESSEEVSDLTEQLEALRAELEASQGGGGVGGGGGGGGGGGMPYPPYDPPSKQAGFGNIPTWAIIGGVVLVAIIAIMSSRRQQPAVVKG
jgi:hypothetical protein